MFGTVVRKISLQTFLTEVKNCFGTNKKFVFFSTVQTEKKNLGKKLVKQIGENV